MNSLNVPAPKLTGRTERSPHDRQALEKPASPALPPLAEKISAVLAEHPYFRRRPPAVHAHEGRVVLQGEVATFYHKQVAQELTRKFDGVHAVENLLHVAW